MNGKCLNTLLPSLCRLHLVLFRLGDFDADFAELAAPGLDVRAKGERLVSDGKRFVCLFKLVEP